MTATFERFHKEAKPQPEPMFGPAPTRRRKRQWGPQPTWMKLAGWCAVPVVLLTSVAVLSAAWSANPAPRHPKQIVQCYMPPLPAQSERAMYELLKAER